MADYYPLIAKAVANLDKSTGEARRALYDRARNALVTQLRSITPPLSESDITRERLALEEAVRKVEAETARRARLESNAPRAERPAPAAPASQPASAPPPPGESPSGAESTEAAGRESERPSPGPPGPSSRAGRPLAGDQPSLSDQGLKGFRDVVAEAEMLGTATVQASKSARETFAAVPAPSPEFERAEPRIEPEGLRPPERRPSAPALGFDLGSKSESKSYEVLPRRYETDHHEPSGTGRPSPPVHPGDLRFLSRRPPHEEEEEEAAARPARSYRGLIVVAALVLLALGTGGLAYWQWPMLAGIFKSAPPAVSPTTTRSTPEPAPAARPKIADRLGADQEATRAIAPGAQEAPVAQRVVLYEEDASDPAGKRYVGSAIWRIETTAASPGQAPEVVVRAEIDVPDRKVTMRWSLRRNTDKALPASHTVEIIFTLPPDFAHGGVSNIPGLLMKQAEQTRGIPLAGSAVKVTDGFFLIGLSALESDMQRNIQLLKERAWFDVPVVYADGRRAIIAVEKGTPGERVFSQAFAAWGQ